MSEPTRKDIIYAHEALETLTDTCVYSGDAAEELKEFVLRALPPIPRPTMAEVEWDDDEHYLAEAETDKGLKVIMLGRCAYDCIESLVKREPRNRYSVFTSNTLTPTGKRYTLTEVQDG